LESIVYKRRTGSTRISESDIREPVVASTPNQANQHLLIIASDKKVYYARRADWGFDKRQYDSDREDVRLDNATGSAISTVIKKNAGKLAFYHTG
jgi:hypothetical protein